MKKTLICSISIVMVLLLCLVSCNTVDKEGLWEEATYRRDTTVGKGDTTVELKVTAGDDSIVITVKTDEKMLGDALLESGIVEGDKEIYGLYVKKVNGIRADYNLDKAYWQLIVNGKSSLVGVDFVEITEGDTYEFVYTEA